MLLLVARTDPPYPLAELADGNHPLLRGVPAPERGVPRGLAAAQQHVLVGVHVGRVDAGRAVLVEGVDLRPRQVDLAHAGIQLGDVDPLGVVVLRLQAERVGADAQVHVLGDEEGANPRLGVAHLQCHRQDEVVGDLRAAEGVGERALADRHPDDSAIVEANPLGQVTLFPQRVELTRHLARVAPPVGQLLLERVDLLEHVDGDDHVVVGEGEYRARIVEEDVRVEDEVFTGHQILAA